MKRSAFEFLKEMPLDRRLHTLLLALAKKQGGTLNLTLQDVLDVEPGELLLVEPSDKTTELVIRFARKGAEAYFLSEGQPSTPSTSRTRAVIPRALPDQPSSSHRSHVPSDLELALMEDERNERRSERMNEEQRRALAESGLLPWQTKTQ